MAVVCIQPSYREISAVGNSDAKTKSDTVQRILCVATNDQISFAAEGDFSPAGIGRLRRSLITGIDMICSATCVDSRDVGMSFIGDVRTYIKQCFKLRHMANQLRIYRQTVKKNKLMEYEKFPQHKQSGAVFQTAVESAMVLIMDRSQAIRGDAWNGIDQDIKDEMLTLVGESEADPIGKLSRCDDFNSLVEAVNGISSACKRPNYANNRMKAFLRHALLMWVFDDPLVDHSALFNHFKQPPPVYTFEDVYSRQGCVSILDLICDDYAKITKALRNFLSTKDVDILTEIRTNVSWNRSVREQMIKSNDTSFTVLFGVLFHHVGTIARLERTAQKGDTTITDKFLRYVDPGIEGEDKIGTFLGAWEDMCNHGLPVLPPPVKKQKTIPVKKVVTAVKPIVDAPSLTKVDAPKKGKKRTINQTQMRDAPFDDIDNALIMLLISNRADQM